MCVCVVTGNEGDHTNSRQSLPPCCFRSHAFDEAKRDLSLVFGRSPAANHGPLPIRAEGTAAKTAQWLLLYDSIGTLLL